MKQALKIQTHVLAALIAGTAATSVAGQTSSLFVTDVQPASQPRKSSTGIEDRLNPALAAVSYTAVKLPEPRVFAVHDLVTIIIREQTSADSTSSLETTKQTKIDGQVTDFPNITAVTDLINLVLKDPKIQDGPKVGVKFKKEFEGEGDYIRRDTFTSRITARVIDIKPNGTMVLEARKFIQSDQETTDIVLMGTCRTEDIAGDNTVLSTQLYDLRVVKEHKGELKSATRKGILTRALEGLFAF